MGERKACRLTEVMSGRIWEHIHQGQRLSQAIGLLRKPTGELLGRDMRLAFKNDPQGFPGGPRVKNPPANAGDMSSIPGPGRFHIL